MVTAESGLNPRAPSTGTPREFDLDFDFDFDFDLLFLSLLLIFFFAFDFCFWSGFWLGPRSVLKFSRLPLLFTK
jgi:hypothetical protein